MNLPLSSPCSDTAAPRWRKHSSFARRQNARGFTLIEMLTAVAILALLFVMLGGILNTMSRTWKEGQQRANNFTKARAMLDLLSRDLQGGLFRSDLVAFPGNPVTVLFYTQRPGISSSTPRDISLVQYQLNTTATTSTLQRGDIAYDWSVNSSSSIAFNQVTLPTIPAGNFRDTSPGIVGFQLLFVYASGTMSTAYPSPLTTATNSDALNSVGISIAVVDDEAMKQLASAGKIQQLRNDLAGTINGTRSVKGDWDAYLQSSLDWKNYPRSLATGLKIFERYVYLPITN